MLISSFLQLLTGRSSQEVSWEQTAFSLMLIIWQAGFPEMGHYASF